MKSLFVKYGIEPIELNVEQALIASQHLTGAYALSSDISLHIADKSWKGIGAVPLTADTAINKRVFVSVEILEQNKSVHEISELIKEL